MENDSDSLDSHLRPSEPVIIKERHGCVTAWLIFMIVINAITSITYLFAQHIIQEYSEATISNMGLIIFGIIGLLHVGFAIAILRWKKWGVWGFLITSVIVFIMNISQGHDLGSSIVGLLGIIILIAILQIKQNGVSAWENLE